MDSRCDICGGTETRPTAHVNVYKLGVDLIECVGCGVRRYTGREKLGDRGTEVFYTTDAYDEYIRKHAVTGTPFPNPTLKPEEYHRASEGVYRGMLQALAVYAKRPVRRVWEIGCAWGQALAVAREMGLEAAGCDLSSAGVDRACAVGLDAVRAPFQLAGVPWPVDGILCNDVLEHTSTPGADLRRAFAITEPGGAIVLKTFYDEFHETLDLDLSRGQYDFKRTGYFDPLSHLYHFTTDALTSAMGRAGWQIASVQPDPSWGQVTVYAVKP